jgi:hypothetical protein
MTAVMERIGCVVVETVILLQKYSSLQHRTRYFWPQAHRATPVGWKVVHDVELELYPPPDADVDTLARSNLT